MIHMNKAHSTTLLLSLTVALAATQASAANGLAPPNNHTAPVPPLAPAADGTLGTALLAAYVNSDATLIRGAGATSSFRNTSCSVSVGCYTVTFNRDVSACFYNVTLYYRDFFVSVQPGSASAVNVFIADPSHNLVDIPFYLTVYCIR